MATRRLYVVRHAAADPGGELTDSGRRQAALLGARLAALPIGAVWHSPLPRAAATAQIVGSFLPGAAVREATELVDHLPHRPAEPPPALQDLFDGYAAQDVEAGARLAASMVARFARPTQVDAHEVLVTHAYQVAWLVRHALDAPADRWLSLPCGNTALTVVEYGDTAPPRLLVHNDMGHLPAELRWTGFEDATLP